MTDGNVRTGTSANVGSGPISITLAPGVKGIAPGIHGTMVLSTTTMSADASSSLGTSPA